MPASAAATMAPELMVKLCKNPVLPLPIIMQSLDKHLLLAWEMVVRLWPCDFYFGIACIDYFCDVAFETNYIDELYPSINIELDNASQGYENKDIDEFHEWAVAMDRKEATLSELMLSESGLELWKKTGFTWIGNFFLADEHPCLDYLWKHLRRKKIDFELT